jgi:hypothetical protein
MIFSALLMPGEVLAKRVPHTCGLNFFQYSMEQTEELSTIARFGARKSFVEPGQGGLLGGEALF